MITAIVQFVMPKGITRAEAATKFQNSAPKYHGLEGLVRKYYLYDAEGVGGGVYLWKSRAAAEKCYDAAWRKMIAERYGAEPEIRFYETQVIVDNVSDEIVVEDAA